MASVLKAALLHVKSHVEYPATKKDLVEVCNNSSDVPAEDREWFTNNLPNKTFNSPTEVIESLLAKI